MPRNGRVLGMHDIFYTFWEADAIRDHCAANKFALFTQRINPGWIEL